MVTVTIKMVSKLEPDPQQAPGAGRSLLEIFSVSVASPDGVLAASTTVRNFGLISDQDMSWYSICNLKEVCRTFFLDLFEPLSSEARHHLPFQAYTCGAPSVFVKHSGGKVLN